MGGCCGGGQNHRPVKRNDSENSENSEKNGLNPTFWIVGVLVIFALYYLLK